MRVLYLTLGVLIADQFTKLLVKGISVPFLGIAHEGMSYGESIPVFGDWFKITYIENPNMAFGLEFGGKLLLVTVAFLASVGIVVYLWRQREGKPSFRIALALILAGALGNLIDRSFYGFIDGSAAIFHGNVVDFINFDLFTVELFGSSFKFWPIWNIADAAVSIGVVLLLIVGMPHHAEQGAEVTDPPQSGDPASDG
jgi:signal peptidase II